MLLTWIGLLACVYVLRRLWFRAIRSRRPPSQLPELPQSFLGSVFGDTSRILSSSNGSATFVRQQVKAFGDAWRTYLYGKTCVYITSTRLLLEYDRISRCPKTTQRIPSRTVCLLHGPSSYTTYGLKHKKDVLRNVSRKSVTTESIFKQAERLRIFFHDSFAGWERQGETLQVQKEIKPLTVRLVFGLFFGWDVMDLESSLAKDVITLKEKGYRSQAPYDLPGFAFREATRARDRVKEFIRSQIKERKTHEFDLLEIGDNIVSRVLNMTTRHKNIISDEDLLDHVFLLLGMMFGKCLNLFAVCVKCVAENRAAVLALRKDLQDCHGISRMSATKMVSSVPVECFVLEALRMYPFAERAYPLSVTDDVTFDNRYTLKRDTYLMLSSTAIHYSTWDDPETFKPERHMQAVIARRSGIHRQSKRLSKHTCPYGPYDEMSAEELESASNVFVPHGFGHRTCGHFESALLLARIFVSTLVLDFDVTVPEPMATTFNATLDSCMHRRRIFAV